MELGDWAPHFQMHDYSPSILDGHFFTQIQMDERFLRYLLGMKMTDDLDLIVFIEILE